MKEGAKRECGERRGEEEEEEEDDLKGETV